MPIPKLDPNKSHTSDEIRKAYLDYGWSDEIEFDWIEVQRGTPHLKRYRFNANVLPCSKRDCVRHQLTFVELRPTGVMKTCATCGQTEGPIATELGILLSDRIVSIPEAFGVIQKTGQAKPVGLDKTSGRRRTRVTIT